MLELVCGRYATTRSALDLTALFDAYDETPEPVPIRYNLAPTDPAPIVRRTTRREGQVLSLATWGLVPSWAPDRRRAARMINARAETVATANAYARAFAMRRALVPADGWYEWRPVASGSGKQAYYMTARDDGPLALAGLWEAHEGRLSFTIVTTAAVGELATVHDRMPLVLPPERWSTWMSTEPEPADLLLATAPIAYLDGLEIRPVTPLVGNVRNDGPELIIPSANDLGVRRDTGVDAGPADARDLTLF